MKEVSKESTTLHKDMEIQTHVGIPGDMQMGIKKIRTFFKDEVIPKHQIGLEKNVFVNYNQKEIYDLRKQEMVRIFE